MKLPKITGIAGIAIGIIGAVMFGLNGEFYTAWWAGISALWAGSALMWYLKWEKEV